MIALLALMLLPPPVAPVHSCQAIEFSGEAVRGKDYVHPLGNHLVFRLRAIASGWRIEVVPDNRPAASHDLAELATPPYLSPTPLLLSTDYSFRAQDAVGWTPRSFRFLTSGEDQAKLSAALDTLARDPKDSSATQTLLKGSKPSAAGKLTIIGAHAVAGSADISGIASSVTSHLNSVAAVADSGGSSKLGQINSVAFTVTLQLDPKIYKAGKAVSVGCE